MKHLSVATLLFMALVACGAENDARPSIAEDIHFTREFIGIELEVPPGLIGERRRPVPRRVEIDFKTSGDVTVSIDGELVLYRGYSGIKTDGKDHRGLLNAYPVAALVGVEDVLRKLVSDNAASFTVTKGEQGERYDYYGASPASAVAFREEVSFFVNGERKTIRASDLYAPGLSYFNRAMGVGKPFDPEEMKVYILLNGAIEVINEIACAISGEYATRSVRPSLRRIIARD